MKQTIYYNGTILTMRGEEIVEAILVEDGRIRDVGSNNEILNRKSPEAEVINLEGKTMLPAFIDPHSHFTSVASMLDKVDLSGCGSMKEIRDRLKAFRKEKGLADDAMLVGTGYDHNDLPGYQHPTAADLVDPELPNPIAIAHASGHMGVANARMLEKLGITKDTPDPEGGRYGRLDDGTPNGYMEENAFIQVVMGMPAPSDEEIAASYAEAQKVYASHGITTAQDGMTSTENAERLEQLASRMLAIWILWATLTSAVPPGPFRMTPIPITGITVPAATSCSWTVLLRAGLPG